MKKIIIARNIMHAIGGHDTILGRGNITTYLGHTSEETLNIHGVRKADMIITDATLPLVGRLQALRRGLKRCDPGESIDHHDL